MFIEKKLVGSAHTLNISREDLIDLKTLVSKFSPTIITNRF